MSKPAQPIEVTSAYLQTNLHWPLVANSDSKTLSKAKIPSLKMFYYPSKQVIKLSAQSIQRKQTSLTIPITNFVNWVEAEAKEVEE